MGLARTAARLMAPTSLRPNHRVPRGRGKLARRDLAVARGALSDLAFDGDRLDCPLEDLCEPSQPLPLRGQLQHLLPQLEPEIDPGGQLERKRRRRLRERLLDLDL